MPSQPKSHRPLKRASKMFKPPRLRRYKKAEPEKVSERYAAACQVRSSGRWKKLQRAKINSSPICEVCNERPALEVHHIVPLSKDISRAYDWDNIQSICLDCHYGKNSHAGK